MSCAVSRYSDSRDVPPATWDALRSPDSMFVSKAWTAALQESNPDVAVEWWVAEDEHGPAAAAPVHLYPGRPRRATYDIWHLRADALQPHDSDALADTRHVLVGTRNGQRGGFLRRPGASRSAARDLVAAVHQMHRDSVVTLLYLDDRTLDVLPTDGGGWRSGFLDATAHFTLPLDGGTGPWIASRRSKRTRQRVTRELAAHAAMDPVQEVRSADVIADLAPALAPLAVNLNRKHGQETSEEAMAGYVRATVRCGLDPVLFTTGDEAGVRGFALCAVGADELSVRLVGFDYERTDRDQEPSDYSRVVLYAPLLHAIEHRLARVDLGVGTLHPKLMRGADVTPLYAAWSVPAHIGDSSTPDDNARVRDVVAQCESVLAPLATSWGRS